LLNQAVPITSVKGAIQRMRPEKVIGLREKDFTGTLEGVAKIGFKEVEFAGYFNQTPEQVRALLDRLGLRAPSSHITLADITKDLPGQVKAAKTIGLEYITVPALFQPLMGKVTPDFWPKTAAEFNRVGKELKAEGIGFAYHNHSFEFEDHDGTAIWETLLAELRPEVEIELDVLWASVGGRDPVTEILVTGDRVRLLHLKDRAAGAEVRDAPPGHGTLEMQEIDPVLTLKKNNLHEYVKRRTAGQK